MKRYENAYAISVLLVLSVLLSYFVSIRNLDIGADSYSYKLAFDMVAAGIYEGRFEPGFVFLMSLVGFVGEGYRAFLFVSSFLMLFFSYCSLMYLARLDGLVLRGELCFSLFLIGFIIISPFFFSMQVNILRHGLAAPFLLLAYCLFEDKRYFCFAIFACLSVFFHWSSAYFLALLPLTRLSVKKLLYVVVGLSVLYLSQISGILVEFVSGKLGFGAWYRDSSEFGVGSFYQSGVRYDFWLFSFFFISLAFFISAKAGAKGVSLKFMLLYFVPFLLMGFVAFSDRLLVYLWFLIPLIISASVLIAFLRLNRTVLFFVGNVSLLFCFGGSLLRLV